jgi:hypothetical protein
MYIKPQMKSIDLCKMQSPEAIACQAWINFSPNWSQFWNNNWPQGWADTWFNMG